MTGVTFTVDLRRVLLQSKSLGKGTLLALVIAMAASFVAEHYGGPRLLYALTFGLALHPLYESAAIQSGVDFSARTLLRLGVVLLGARITADQILALGWQTAAMVMVAMTVTIALGLGLARRLGLPAAQGMLSSGSVAICGASAAMALSAVLPQNKANTQFTLLVVVGVTLLSTLAMVIYPYLSHLMGFNDLQSGIFLGATIHDVAQVVAAGMLLSPDAGATATVVKLFRVLLLLPIVSLAALAFQQRAAVIETNAQKPPLFPLFLLGFIVMVALSSIHVIPPSWSQTASQASGWLLVVAISAAGVKTSFADLALLGWRPILMLVSETAVLAACVVVTLASTA